MERGRNWEKTGFISVRCHKNRQKDEMLLLLPPLTIPQSRGSHLGHCGEEKGERGRVL